MLATARIAAAQIIPSYSQGGADLMQYTVYWVLASVTASLFVQTFCKAKGGSQESSTEIFAEDMTCSFGDMPADRQTHRHTNGHMRRRHDVHSSGDAGSNNIPDIQKPCPYFSFISPQNGSKNRIETGLN